MRELGWDGYRNARDLGGLPTTLSPTGSTIVGRVARGPRRELLTRHGWKTAADWGLRSVVDLRCAFEIGPRDDDPIDASPEPVVTIVNAPTEDHSDPEFQRVCFPILDSPEYWKHNWRIQPHLVRNALEAIASARPGVLIHCSAGRDRTGMIAALLLGNAGVPPQVVAADYAESVRSMGGVPSTAPTIDRQTGWSAEQVDAWLAEVTPIVLDVAAHAAEAFDRVGVSHPVRTRLRGLLTDATNVATAGSAH